MSARAVAARCRLARPDEIERVREIQRATGQLFLNTDIAFIADDPPDSAEALAAAQDRWELWVSTDGTDRPVGGLWAVPDGADLHIKQLDVDPAFARQRRGEAMIQLETPELGTVKNN